MYKMFESFSTLILLLIIHSIVCNSCPFRSAIEALGCDCGEGLEDIWISCETEQFSQVIKELGFRSKYNNKTHFEELYLRSESLETIGQNFFDRISFKAITFHNCSSLKSIDSNAFNGIDNNILYFEVSGDNQLSDENVFQVISKMQNLRTLRLSDTKLTLIPKNAFTETQTNLTKISFDIDCSHSPIKSVEERAFYGLTNLIHLDLSCLQLDSIDSNAFEFKSSENQKKLFIDLSNNRLNENSFAKDFRVGTERSVDLNINYNHLKHLNQTIFQRFLDSNPENRIQLWNNRENTSLDCDSCQTNWLRLYSTQISDTFCSDGQTLLSKRSASDKCLQLPKPSALCET